MKKIIVISILATLFILFTSSSANKIKTVPYYVRCYKCYDEVVPNSHIRTYSMAYRSFKDEHNDSEYKGYCIYKCEHGHKLYINYLNNDKK